MSDADELKKLARLAREAGDSELELKALKKLDSLSANNSSLSDTAGQYGAVINKALLHAPTAVTMAADIPAFLVNQLNHAQNYVNNKLDVTDNQPVDAGDLPYLTNTYLQGINEIQNATNEAGVPVLADPQTKGQAYTAAAVRGAAGAAGGIGVGQRLAESASPMVKSIGELLSAQAPQQIVSGAGAGVSSEAAKQSGLGQGGQIAASLAGGLAAGSVANRLLPNNVPLSVQQQTLADSQAAGYVVPPAMADNNGLASGIGKILGGLSGKAKTEQLADIKNQKVTDSLARRGLGLPADAPLTTETTKAVRGAAYQNGYRPLESLGSVATDKQYVRSLDRLVENYKGAANSFPAAVNDKVSKIIDGLKVESFDSGEALKMTQILRDDAGTAFRNGESAIGKANIGAAKAIEDQIERNIKLRSMLETGMGSKSEAAAILKDFRNARTLMAKTHTIEKAIRAGGGSVDAASLGRDFQKGRPLTGELKTIGAFANNFKEAARMPKGGDANPLSVLDLLTGTVGLGGMGIFGHQNPESLGLMAFPAARVAARYGVLSPLGQQLFAKPSTNANNLGPLIFPSIPKNQQ